MIWHETPITVRFNEVDAYQVAWHGHFVAWMEVGRNDLTGRFDLNAQQIGAAGYRAPVVKLELNYKRPALFNEELKVGSSVRRTECATLEFLARITGADGVVIATGKTLHVLTDEGGTLLYQLPPVIARRMDRLFAFLGGE